MTSEQKLHKAKIIGQIQSCYSDIAKSLDTTISHEDFTNAYKESITEGSAFKFYTEDVVKGFCESALKDLEKSDSATSRSDIDKQLSGLEKITVVSDNGLPVSIFAETKDVEKGDYLDNTLNRFLGRVDIEKSEGSRGGKVIGHTKSGKPIYNSHSHEGHKNFTAQDHTDAYKIHGDISKKYETPNKSENFHNKQGKLHFNSFLSERDKE